MKRIYLFIIVLGLISGACKAQTKMQTPKNKVGTPITNDNVRYSIGLLACDTCAPIRNIGYRVILDLSEEQQKAIKNLNSEAWLRMLKDSTSDFAANLVLYSMFDRNAIVLARNNSIALWRKYLK